jgi:hypothetical protein
VPIYICLLLEQETVYTFPPHNIHVVRIILKNRAVSLPQNGVKRLVSRAVCEVGTGFLCIVYVNARHQKANNCEMSTEGLVYGTKCWGTHEAGLLNDRLMCVCLCVCAPNQFRPSVFFWSHYFNAIHVYAHDKIEIWLLHSFYACVWCEHQDEFLRAIPSADRQAYQLSRGTCFLHLQCWRN